MPKTKKPPKQKGTLVGPIFRVTDLTGGVNLRPSATSIKPEEARRLVGTNISSPGELGVYPGWLMFSTTSLANRRAQGGKRIYIAGASPFTLVADNGSVYKPNDSGVWGSSVLGSLNSANQIDFVHDRDIVAVFDGSTAPSKSKTGASSSWTPLGIPAPSAPTVSAVAGGSLVSGQTYEVSYAYGDTTLNHYSNATDTAQQAVSGANLTVRVGVTASGRADVNSIKVYARNVTAGQTVRRLTATLSNTTANHDITVDNWDGQEEAPTDHNPAVAMAFGLVWKNRWWGRDATVGNRLRFSQIFQNQSWPTTFFVDIPFERGDTITALMAIGDILVVFGFTRFYLVIGQTSLDFEVRPAQGAQTGALGFRAVDIIENGIVHGGAPGAYLFNGATDELLTDPIDTAWLSMVDATSAGDLAALPLVYHKQSKEVRVGVQSLFPINTPGEWILDLNRSEPGKPSWFSTVRRVGGYIQWDGNEPVSGNQGRLFSWDTATVQLAEERIGVTANGLNRVMEYDGYMLPFGLQNTRVIDTYIECQQASGALTANLKIDERLVGEQTVQLGSDLAKVGTAIIGTSTIGAIGRMSLPFQWPLTAEGRSAQLLMKYVGTGDFKVFSYGHNSFSEPVPRGI